MKEQLKHLAELTDSKSSNDIRSYLEALPHNEKGKVFEHYLSYLFEGNGYVVKVSGGKGDLGADILLYNPKTPHQVDLIIQAKNWSKPLPEKDVRHELHMFEDRGKKKYNCTFYTLISTNGFVKEAHKLSEFNMALHDWKYVESLIGNYDLANKETASIDLRSHNQVSFDKTIEGFQINNRICVIQATGTGKSYVTARLIQEHIDRKALLVAPSNLILKQFEENFHYILANTKLITYATLANVMKKESKEYGLIILDEFHRCGAEVWGAGVKTLLAQNPKALVFGTSATPIRTLDQGRDMSDEIFDSYVANQITLPDAIVRSILPEPKYVSALYNIDEDVESTIALIMGSKKRAKEKTELVEEIKNAKIDWEKTSGIPEIFKKHIPIDEKPKKFIVFCQNKDHLADMELDVQKWLLKAFGRGWNRSPFTITSEIDKRINERTIDEFKSANSSKTIYLMFSIDMFNEGLHLPDVDGVILLRPTQSDRIFLQQIGRCLQVGSASAQPLIFDLVNNFMSLRSFNFRESLDNSSREYNKRREQLGLDPRTVDVEIIDEAKDIVELFEKTKNKILPWNIQFHYLEEFINQNSRFPTQIEEYPKGNSLGGWCSHQRALYKENKLDKYYIDKLESIDFSWDAVESLWDDQYNYLVEFVNKHQRFPNTDEKYPLNNNLGTWCGTQRMTYKNNKLSSERIKKLENLGFKWTVIEDKWNAQLEYLKEYLDKFNLLPEYNINYPTDNKLGAWCSRQRSLYRENKLSKNKINQLESIGFIWEPLKSNWEKQFRYLEQYVNENNHFPDSNTIYPLENNLGLWCINQRFLYNNNRLSKDRIIQLESIGFIWDSIDQDWEKQFTYLQEYNKIFNTFPAQKEEYPSGNNLGNWLSSQRHLYFKNKLSDKYISKLESIGMIWSPKIHKWDLQFKYLKEFIDKYGIFPKTGQEYPTGNKLSNWCGTQRNMYEKGSLSKDRFDKLESIRFNWDQTEYAWNIQFNYLKEFINSYNRLPITTEKFPEDNKLGGWCVHQRQKYKINDLPKDKIKKLESIGFIWSGHDDEWQRQYQYLKDFILKFNRFPKAIEKFPEDNKLGGWVQYQRNSFNKQTLSRNRLSLLDKIGFPFVIESNWHNQYNYLSNFINQYSRFPNSTEEYPKNNRLGNWVSKQRSLYTNGRLSKKRVKLLEEIEIVWGTIEYRWELQFNYLKEFIKNNKRLPKGIEEFPKGTRLGDWVLTQKRFYKKGKLIQTRIDKLKSINFPFPEIKEKA